MRLLAGVGGIVTFTLGEQVRVGVTHLMTSYQYLADTGKVERLAQLFAPDGVMELLGEKFTGPDEILGLFTRTSGQFTDAAFLPARHHLSSIYVEPLPDGSAKTYACFQFIGTRGLDHWGTYRDIAVVTEDGWRFKHRRVTVEGFAPGSHLAPGSQSAPPGRRADPQAPATPPTT